MSARASKLPASPPASDFSDCRSILRLCPKDAWVTSDNSFVSQASGAGRGTSSTREDLTLGGGVKAVLGDHWLVRVDFRDYATPFPENVIVPAPGAKIHGWLHDFVPLFGVDWTFGK